MDTIHEIEVDERPAFIDWLATEAERGELEALRDCLVEQERHLDMFGGYDEWAECVADLATLDAYLARQEPQPRHIEWDRWLR